MAEPIDTLLADYPIVVEATVAWGDMDAFQHVNNTVYFRWFESGRIAYFRALGFDSRGDGGGGPAIGPILAATDCRFRLPLAYPDRVSIGTRVSELGSDRFTMEYAVVSHELGALAASGSGLIVSYDYAARAKAPLPDEIRHRIEELERRDTR